MGAPGVVDVKVVVPSVVGPPTVEIIIVLVGCRLTTRLIRTGVLSIFSTVLVCVGRWAVVLLLVGLFRIGSAMPCPIRDLNLGVTPREAKGENPKKNHQSGAGKQ